MVLKLRMVNKGTAGDCCVRSRSDKASNGRSDQATQTDSQQQFKSLQDRFPGSPRIGILHGLRLEATGDIAGAGKVYKDLLAIDETNVVSLQIAHDNADDPSLHTNEQFPFPLQHQQILYPSFLDISTHSIRMQQHGRSLLRFTRIWACTLRA
jgi:hypothetical protein